MGARLRFLLDVGALPGSNPPPDRAAPPRARPRNTVLARADTAVDHSHDPRPVACAVPGGASGSRSVSPVLDWSKTTGFRHLVNRLMFCGDSVFSQLNTMIARRVELAPGAGRS
ncbi:hypothetical protein GCM10022254_12820 [Actinomadura meridiana]|uniref:Uncharacterized protein n=1 Tax=Actinomadura meridiana TaxID=559626 RepID=A0ABP8BUM6_9ACTN